MSVHAASKEEEEEEKWLNVALFATQCVENLGLSSDRHNHTHPHGKKKRPQRIAPSGALRSDKDQLTLIAYEHKRKRDLWNADSELILWNNISVLVGHFERHLWALVPLHPSVLQEDNVKFALMGQQSERMEDFPLLFNVNVAMACVLKLVGHKQREEEFMMRARHQLEYLFDSSHLEIAEGLLCMAYYSFCQAQMTQFSYYVTLARNILRRLKAFGSDIYSRALWYSMLDPNTSIEEKQSTLCEYNNNVDSHQPYQSAHTTAVDPDLVSIIKLRSACHLMVELKKSTISHTPSSPEADNAFFSSLAFGIEFLQQLFQEWRRRGTVTFVLALELDFFVMRSVYHHLRQDDDQALYWAAQYTKLVQERAADMQHMPAMHLPSSFKIVADVLVETGKWRLLKLLLAAVHGWISSYPITLLHAERYQQQLAINFDHHNNNNNDDDDDENDDDEEEEEEEEDSEDKEDAAEGFLETGSPTWWASQVI